jgi:hypothetical protein
MAITGLDIDPDKNIVVTCGSTEARFPKPTASQAGGWAMSLPQNAADTFTEEV